jgi:hypothetical protein
MAGLDDAVEHVDATRDALHEVDRAADGLPSTAITALASNSGAAGPHASLPSIR